MIPIWTNTLSLYEYTKVYKPPLLFKSFFCFFKKVGYFGVLLKKKKKEKLLASSIIYKTVEDFEGNQHIPEIGLPCSGRRFLSRSWEAKSSAFRTFQCRTPRGRRSPSFPSSATRFSSHFKVSSGFFSCIWCFVLHLGLRYKRGYVIMTGFNPLQLFLYMFRYLWVVDLSLLLAINWWINFVGCFYFDFWRLVVHWLDLLGHYTTVLRWSIWVLGYSHWWLLRVAVRVLVEHTLYFSSVQS